MLNPKEYGHYSWTKLSRDSFTIPIFKGIRRTDLPLSPSLETTQRAQSLSRCHMVHIEWITKTEVPRNKNLRTNALIETGGANVAMSTACIWHCKPPRSLFCTKLGVFPGAAGDGMGHFLFGEVIVIIITGFCQYYRNWWEKKKRD